MTWYCGGKSKEGELIKAGAVGVLFEVIEGWIHDILSFLKEREDNPVTLAFAERVSEESGVPLDRVFNYLNDNWPQVVDQLEEILEDAWLFIEELKEQGGAEGEEMN
jgi:hypothetical protein